jgi:cell division protein FtsI (penicillin-binding protein 3)
MSSSRSIRRRLAVAVLAVIAVVAVFTVRLVDLQVVQAETLQGQADRKRVISQPLYGVRGNIVDANGIVLADSVERYNITASPKNMMDKDGELAPSFDRYVIDETTGERTRVEVDIMDGLAELGELTGQSAAEIRKIVEADPESDFQYVRKSVKLEALLAVRELGIPGIYDEPVASRTYPNGAIAGNLVGFIGTDGPQAGIEMSQDACLASTNGESTVERSEDWVQLPGTRTVTKEPKNGGDVRLTIDQNLQWYAQQTLASQGAGLGADWATAMVVDVSNGHIKAAADWPTVDPNDPSSADRSALGARLFAAPYEPGSTIKAATVASLLDAGVTTQDERFEVPGFYTNGLPDGSYIKDAWAHDTIRWTTAGILMNSSNIGISMLSEKLPEAERQEYLRKFGLGEKTAVDFQYENGGSLIENPDSITSLTQQFGQGMTATSAQVASIYQTIGNGGVKMPLTLVEGCEHADGTITGAPTGEGERVVSEQAADQTVQILENVVSQGSQRSVLTIPGYRVAAKTGTAEVAENGRYGSQRIVSVAGLVPAEDPQYAIVVTFAKPDTMRTSAAAAPAFNAIMKQVIKTFRITPSTTAAPNIPLVW